MTESARLYNASQIGVLYFISDLPEDWPGRGILEAGDVNHDLVLDPDEELTVDWDAYEAEAGTFQKRTGLHVDGWVGPNTLRMLRTAYGKTPHLDTGPLTDIEGVKFYRAEEPTAPPAKKVKAASLLGRRIADLWNMYGQGIAEAAAANGIPIEAALATFAVETNGRGYDAKTGLLLIQFEDHVFSRIVGQPRRKPRYRSQSYEWGDLRAAAAVNVEAAFDSTSGGLAQAMGFNAELVGYKSAVEMFLAFQRSCKAQIAAFFAYVKGAGLVDEIKRNDWYYFSKGYNGPGRPAYYASHIKNALREINALKSQGAQFVI